MPANFRTPRLKPSLHDRNCKERGRLFVANWKPKGRDGLVAVPAAGPSASRLPTTLTAEPGKLYPLACHAALARLSAGLLECSQVTSERSEQEREAGAGVEGGAQVAWVHMRGDEEREQTEGKHWEGAPGWAWPGTLFSAPVRAIPRGPSRQLHARKHGAQAAATTGAASCLASQAACTAANFCCRAALSRVALLGRRRWKKSSVPST